MCTHELQFYPELILTTVALKSVRVQSMTMLVWYTGFRSVAFWKKILLLSFFYFSVFGESTSVRGCANLVNSPFEMCTIAGYNHTIPFPEKLDDSGKRESAKFFTILLKTFSCAQPNLAAALECSFIVPKCGSNGQRVYPSPIGWNWNN